MADSSLIPPELLTGAILDIDYLPQPGTTYLTAFSPLSQERDPNTGELLPQSPILWQYQPQQGAVRLYNSGNPDDQEYTRPNLMNFSSALRVENGRLSL